MKSIKESVEYAEAVLVEEVRGHVPTASALIQAIDALVRGKWEPYRGTRDEVASELIFVLDHTVNLLAEQIEHLEKRYDEQEEEDARERDLIARASRVAREHASA